MEEIDFLKTVDVNEDEAQKVFSFFDTMTDEQVTDIFAAFSEYEKPHAYIIADLYYYHLFRLHKNKQWNDHNLRQLSSKYVLNKWVIYGRSFYVIAHPNKPASRRLIKHNLQPFLVSAFGEETSSLTLTNERGKSIRLSVPAYQLAELEYTIKEAYREQAQKIDSGFTYYKEEIGLWLEETFRIKPQLSGFVDWMFNHKEARGFNMKITETEKTADYVKADLEFDFTPLYSLKGDELRSDLINYCKFVREECKKMVAASTDTNQKKTGRTKDPCNAKVKAKFLSEIIDAGIVENSTCRNNNEKFAHYAKVLQSDYGLVVNAGTLENNWNKPLNDDEKRQLRELFIAQNLRRLAVKIATHQ